MTSPAVLLVDEPTSALDRVRSAEAVRLIAEQTHRHGTATVMVTHDTAIMDAADRVHEMVDGRCPDRGGGLTTPGTVLTQELPACRRSTPPPSPNTARSSARR